MPEPLVSVVVPTFRREERVCEAVRSALVQRGVVVEVIVLDDSPEGSAAGSIAALDDPRVRYVHRRKPSDGHPAEVRNEGLALARGTYVHFLDDDDILEDGALAATVGALERTPSAGVAIGLVEPFGDDLDALRHERAYFANAARKLRSVHTRFALVATMLFDTTPLVNSACTIRRGCADAVGGYSTSVTLCEDVDFYLRAIRSCGFVLVDQPVIRYQTGMPSLMHSQPDYRVVRESYRVIYQRYRQEHGRLEFNTMRAFMLLRSLIGALPVVFGGDAVGAFL